MPFNAKNTNNVLSILLKAKKAFKQQASQRINNSIVKPMSSRQMFTLIKKKKISFMQIRKKYKKKINKKK